MKTILTLAAAVLTGLAATAGNATTVAVRYADLNLATVEGRTAMTGRINHAATVVCGTSLGERDLGDRVAIAKCRSAAIAAATKTIDARHPALLALR